MRGGVAVSTRVLVVALMVVSNVFAVEVGNGFTDDKHFLLGHRRRFWRGCWWWQRAWRWRWRRFWRRCWWW
ncbi:hypothetical protein AMTR_s00133p00084760 [Amborella trichopoda]|uniref:Uncharacterized protein n=1 Tax=Amborella trichopoda TaxID=13333 RepID=W1P9R8_AMBTC|nr:hypothetical protein AMTR_s00133p00084760 [Amborella trichopoda]